MAETNPMKVSAIAPTTSQIATEHNKYQFQNLIYPLEMENDPGLGHYVIFNINESAGSKFKTSLQETETTNMGDFTPTFNDEGVQAAGTAGGVGKLSVPRSQRSDAAAQSAGADRQRLHLGRTTVRSVQAIILYMPAQLSSTYGFVYDNQEMSGAAALMGAARGIKEVFATGNVKGTVGPDLARRIGLAGLQNVADKLTNLTGIGDAKGIVSSTFRSIINPHMNLLFKTINPRTFAFEFDFMPKNEDEAQAVQNIITAFKFHAHPEIKGSPGEVSSGMFWTFPSEFEIHFFSHGIENDFIHKIGVCACTGIDINATPDGQLALHEASTGAGYTTGNPPVRQTMRISFQEVDLLTKERIMRGY